MRSGVRKANVVPDNNHTGKKRASRPEETQLTARQRDMLRFIVHCINTQGRAPTIRELMAACNVPSSSNVAYNLDRLEERGYITRDAIEHQSRSAYVLERERRKAERTHSRAGLLTSAAATEALQAVGLLRTANDRIAAGLANVVAGSAHAASSDPEAAGQRFAAAIALFEECGAPHQVEHALREQQRTNARRRLTPRELATLRLLAESLTADGIARRLGVAPGTIHKHLASLYRKLGTNDRLETVLCAQRLGLFRR